MSGHEHPAPRRRATQREVARLVGVSTAAVSYAFNGSPGVSKEIRDQIFQVAKEIGFRPNRAAQGLRRGRMNVIGLLLADIANPFYPEIASGVLTAAAQRGNQVFLAQVGIGGALQAEAARNLVDRGCDGLVFTSVVDDDAELLQELRDQGVPFVYANRRSAVVEADWVHIDDTAAAQEAVEHVLSGGSRRIAVIGGPPESSVSADRTAGALHALSRAGLQPVRPDLSAGELSRDSGRWRAAALLGEHPEVDAIVCGNDMIALGVLDECHDRGVRVPEQLSVIGFDDMSFASAGPLQLTTVSVPRQLMGERAVALLADRIDGDDSPVRDECLPHRLEIRATTSAI